MRTLTTWSKGSTWNYGETKTIRVPVALASEILEYARYLDSRDKAEKMVGLLEEFIQIKRRQSPQARHYPKTFNTDKPTWLVFNEFYRWVQSKK